MTPSDEAVKGSVSLYELFKDSNSIKKCPICLDNFGCDGIHEGYQKAIKLLTERFGEL